MDTTLPNQERTKRFQVGFVAGLAAGAVASGSMLLLNVLFGGLSLPEVFGSELTALMPPPLFAYLHQLIGGDAKHYLFYGILVGQCLVFALGAGLYNLALGLIAERAKATPSGSGTSVVRAPTTNEVDRSLRVHYYDGLLLALILWLFSGLILLPLTGGGVFGGALTVGIIGGMWSLAVVGLIFGLLYVVMQNWLLSTQVGTQTVQTSKFAARRARERRTLLKRGAIVVGVGIVGVGLWRFITAGYAAVPSSVAQLTSSFKRKIVPPPVPNYGPFQQVPNLSTEITSNAQYYVVSKNLFSDPTVNSNGWSLKVHGQVDHPYTLNYNELLALPMQQQYESMMCISNEVGGEYMSSAKWEGVRLIDLLQKAGVRTGSTKIVFRAVDDYSDSIHLAKALEPTTLLAVRMNDQTLPDGHGFPARMLVPGIYGMKHCKWINDIEIVNYDFQGYWQQRGWDDAAPVRLTSRIDTPLDGTGVRAGSQTYVAGVAFSGNLGVSEVDLSFDNGKTWQRATLKRPLSGLTWVLWEFPWQAPAKAGSYSVIARAVDLQGNVQDPDIEPPLPIGSSGYHTITITVS